MSVHYKSKASDKLLVYSLHSQLDWQGTLVLQSIQVGVHCCPLVLSFFGKPKIIRVAEMAGLVLCNVYIV